MPRVMPILFKLQQPFEAKGFAPLFPVQYRTTATPAVATLADNFDDNSRDATKWNLGTLKVNATAGATTVAEANQRLEVTPVTAPSGNTYSGYISASVYDLTGSSVYVKIQGSDGDSFGNEITAVEAYIGVGTDQNNAYLALINCLGTCQIRQQKAGAESNVGSSFAYSASTHAWLRLRFDATNVYLDTAPRSASDPPVSGDWTNQVSGARDVAIDITQSFLAIGAGSYSGGSVPTVYFDGFNTATTPNNVISVSPATGHLALTGYLPTVTLATNVAPSVGHLVIGGKVPTISTTFNIAPSTGHLTIGGKAPSVFFGTAVSPSTGHLTLGGHTPSVTLTVNVAPSTGHLAIGGKVPTVSKTFNVSPAAGHLSLSGKTPTVTLTVNIAPATGHLLLTGYSPTVDNGSGSGAVAAQPLKVMYRHRNRN